MAQRAAGDRGCTWAAKVTHLAFSPTSFTFHRRLLTHFLCAKDLEAGNQLVCLLQCRVVLREHRLHGDVQCVLKSTF